MHLDQIPDGAKVAVSVASPVLSFLGIPVQEWGYVLSAIVSLLFIIEKTPMLIERVKYLIKKVRNAK